MDNRIEIPWYSASVRKGSDLRVEFKRANTYSNNDWDSKRWNRGRIGRPPTGTVPVEVTVPVTVPVEVPVDLPNTSPSTSPTTNPIGGSIGVDLPNNLPVLPPVFGKNPDYKPDTNKNPRPTVGGTLGTAILGNVPNYTTRAEQMYIDSQVDSYTTSLLKQSAGDLWNVIDVALTAAMFIPAANLVATPLRGASAILRTIASWKNIKSFGSFILQATKAFGVQVANSFKKTLNSTNYKEFINAVKNNSTKIEGLLGGI